MKLLTISSNRQKGKNNIQMTSLIARGAAPVLLTILSIAIIILAFAVFSTGPFALTWKILSAISLMLLVFSLFFFRDPERITPQNPNNLMAPADGIVISIKEVNETEFIKGKAKRISIFMSVFNVHVNRAPTSGNIEYIKYNPGKFISAFKEKASEDNENLLIGIQCNQTPEKIAVRFIAGLIARRIVFYKKMHDNIKQGDRINMIRFGSRVDLFCPPDSLIKIQIGDKVSAGETLMAVLKDQ